MKEAVKELSYIVFALNGQSPRLEGSLKAMITIIQQMFTVEVWKNLSVVFKNCQWITMKKRNKKITKHDIHISDGFAKTIQNEFKPAEGSKQLEYFFIDSHFDEEVEEELEAIEANKEAFWNILNKNLCFSTNLVQNS